MFVMRDRKLSSIRHIDSLAATRPSLISYNPGTMTEPLPATVRAMATFRRGTRGHPVAAYENCRAVLRDLRLVASEVLGGRPHEWAHADGHTATIDRVAGALAQYFAHADAAPIRVVSTRHEHVGGLGAFAADPRFAVFLVEPEEIDETEAEIYFLSQITYDTNRDLTPEIRRLTSRATGAVVVVDGTQAAGQIDVDVAALGCDAFLTSAHKWLGGPHGAGLLYLRQDVIERWPTPFHAGDPLCTDLPIGRWEPRGGQDFARCAGVAAALRAHQCHAKPGGALRARFIETLETELGGDVRIIRDSAPHGRVVAFALPGRDVYPVYRRLIDQGISVKCIKRGGGLEVLRIGFPWWATEVDVMRASRALVKAVRESPTLVTASASAA